MKKLILANRELLKESAILISNLDDNLYSQSMCALSSGSIGQHMRHVFDHYQAILKMTNFIVDYDCRRRDVRLESDKNLALIEIEDILSRLPHLIDSEIIVKTEISTSVQEVAEVRSTVHRELLFVTSHAVHHFALVAMLLRLQRIDVPVKFGVAPATLTHQRTQG